MATAKNQTRERIAMKIIESIELGLPLLLLPQHWPFDSAFPIQQDDNFMDFLLTKQFVIKMKNKAIINKIINII